MAKRNLAKHTAPITVALVAHVVLVCGPIFAQGREQGHEHGDEAMLQSCENQPENAVCSFENFTGEAFEGTCQLMVDTMVCVGAPAVEAAEVPTTEVALATKSTVVTSAPLHYLILGGIVALLVAIGIMLVRRNR